MSQAASGAVIGTVVPKRRRRSFLRALVRLARREPVMMVSLGIIVVIVFIAVVVPFLGIQPPQRQDFLAYRKPPGYAHWFGTDWLGRDLFSQMVHGARTSLTVGVSSVLLGASLGFVWGVLSGFAGGKVDMVSNRFIEVLMAFPTLVLALALAAVLPGGMFTVIIAIAMTRIGTTARVIRGVTISTMPSPYVDAARAIGAHWVRIAVRHVAPSTLAPFIVLATGQLAVGILVEATLGFLGVGVPPPTPSWGAMLAGSMTLGNPPWWLTVIPGSLIAILVLAFNLAGDGLRDTLDPRLRGNR